MPLIPCSLIMARLQFNAAPMYILDEINAALDLPLISLLRLWTHNLPFLTFRVTFCHATPPCHAAPPFRHAAPT